MFGLIVLWLPVLLGGVYAESEMRLVITNAASAPQEGAGAAMAVAYIVIPYCFCRALSEMHVGLGIQRVGETVFTWLELMWARQVERELGKPQTPSPAAETCHSGQAVLTDIQRS